MATTAVKEKPVSPVRAGEPMHPRPFKVLKNQPETHDTFTLELEPADGPREFRFAPGQFNMLYVYGFGEVPISISGDPAEPGVLVHTVRTVGTVTRALERLKRGGLVGVRGPFGTSWPVAEAQNQDLVIVAGGIGLAPLRPVMVQALVGRERFGKIVLLYGARTPDDLLYVRELEQWRSRLDLEILVTVDRALGAWQGNVGVVTTLFPRASFDPFHALALVCGPEVMMRFATLELAKRGTPAEKTYLSMERNMKCGIGLCGHCQIGPTFVCKEGPVYRFDRVKALFGKREL